eukprot:g9122.t1
MIDPLRYRSLQEQLEFDEDESPMQCWRCLREERVSTPAFFLCHDCGKAGDCRPFCEPCFFDYHLTRRRGKDWHKPHPIVQGDPVTVQTLADGDGATFPKMHDWVTLDYTLTTDGSDVAIEDTFLTKQPLTFQSGCSGPCIHLQLLGCTEIAAADIMGASDPYCAVYWKNEFVGVTTTKHMTLNPKWANQTFVLPLAAEFVEALVGGEEGCSVLFKAGALLPKLRIELYDWDRLSKNDFLGQATVNDAEILRILRQAQSGERDENHVLSFDLEAKQSRGQLGVRVALRGSKLYVHVVQAENLPKADPFSLSDPYCEVYWNDKRIGKTVHIDDTLDPTWDLEIFSVRVDQDGPNSVEESTLRIVCLDWDQFGSDDVLGQIELAGSQIKQLAESKDGDEVVSDNGAGMGEADMEKVFDFVRLLQEHEMDEAGLGKMVVGVPQDPNIVRGKDLEEASEAVEQVEPSKKKKRKKRRKHGGAEHGGGGGAETEANSSQKTRPAETLGSDADPARNTIDELMPGGNKTELGAGVTQTELVHESQAAENARGEGGENRGEVGETAVAIEDCAGGPIDEARVSEVGTGLRSEDGDKEGVDARTPRGGPERTPDVTTESAELLYVDALETMPGGKEGGNQALLSESPPKGEKTSDHGLGNQVKLGQGLSPDTVEVLKPNAGVTAGDPGSDAADAGLKLPSPHKEGDPEKDAGDAGFNLPHVPETEANRDMAGDQLLSDARDEGGKTAKLAPDDQTLLPTAPGKGKDTSKPVLGREEHSAKDVVPIEDDVQIAPQTADDKNGGGCPKKSPAAAGQRNKRDRKTTVHVCYRDAKVQRFEEGRGVLVEYLDDGSSAWVETKFIPRLQIRQDAPVARNVFQRLWDLRHKVFNLQKRVLNVKRAVKVLMGVAMTGSRMQWYPLGLTDEQSGANFVRGTVDCRFLYHTRGSVLRGLDVAVSHMSLGERARVEVRSDYGFGEVYASRNVAPYATLIFVAQVAAIGHHNAKWLIIRRALRDKMEDALFRFRLYLSSAASSYGVARRLVGLLGSLRRRKRADELAMLGDEEESLRNPAVAVEEGEATNTASKEVAK